MDRALKEKIIEIFIALFLIIYVVEGRAMQNLFPADDDWASKQPKIQYGDFNDYLDGKEDLARQIITYLGYNVEQISGDIVDFALEKIKELADQPAPGNGAIADTQVDSHGIFSLITINIQNLLTNIPSESVTHFKFLMGFFLMLVGIEKLSDVLIASWPVTETDNEIPINKTLQEDMCGICTGADPQVALEMEAFQEDEADQCFIPSTELEDLIPSDDSDHDQLPPFIISFQPQENDVDTLVEPVLADHSEDNLPAHTPAVAPVSSKVSSSDGESVRAGYGYAGFMGGITFIAQTPCIVYEGVKWSKVIRKPNARKRVKKAASSSCCSGRKVVWGACEVLAFWGDYMGDIAWVWYFSPSPTKSLTAAKTKSIKAKNRRDRKNRLRKAQNPEGKISTPGNSTYINMGLLGCSCEVEAFTLASVTHLGELLLLDSFSILKYVPDFILQTPPALVGAGYYWVCASRTVYDDYDSCTYVAIFATSLVAGFILHYQPQLSMIPVAIVFAGSAGVVASFVCRTVRKVSQDTKNYMEN